MNIIFPTVGNTIEITKDFTFNLYAESRNDSLFNHLNITDRPKVEIVYDETANRGYWRGIKSYLAIWPSQWTGVREFPGECGPYTTVTLPAGTLLTVDRIYIRKGAPTYDSITFWAKIPNVKKKVRFWVKIIDINGKLEGNWV